MSDKAVFDLGQGHGNHFDCITEESDRDELIKQLPEMLQRAKLTVSPGALIPCSLGEGYPRQLQCAMLADSEDALHLNMLIGLNINGERNELISFYPEMNGAKIPVTLTDIHEWGNGLEATLEGTICNGEHHIAFLTPGILPTRGNTKSGKATPSALPLLPGTASAWRIRLSRWRGSRLLISRRNWERNRSMMKMGMSNRSCSI